MQGKCLKCTKKRVGNADYLCVSQQQKKHRIYEQNFQLFYYFNPVCLGALLAQPNRRTQDESTLPGKRSELNVRNATYPRLLPGNRIEFKIKAPDAPKSTNRFRS